MTVANRGQNGARRAALREWGNRGLLLALATAAAGCVRGLETRGTIPGAAAGPSIPPPDEWTLAWADEFDEGPIDEGNWTLEEILHPPNSELQAYTARGEEDSRANVRVERGLLVIEARPEAYGGRDFTSGRIVTRGKREFLYGRFEARMRFPPETGTWPAFWLLGATFGDWGWPRCGEIDIAEGKGRVPNWVAGAVHAGASPRQHWTVGREYLLPHGSFQDEWHVFAVEWEPDKIRWFVDDTIVQSLQGPEDPASDPVGWPFGQGHPFFIIINLALGGWFDAPHDPPVDMAPQRLLVDYVRVYRRTCASDRSSTRSPSQQVRPASGRT